MEDIQEYLKNKDAIAACFRIDSKTCRISIATKSQEQLKEIVNGWDEIRTEYSDLHYMFREISFLPREGQICLIQSEIEARGATALIRSEEQKIAEICAENGASGVWYKHYGDRMEFLIYGNLEDEIMDQLREVSKNHQHIYMNPPRCKWTYSENEVEVLGSVGPVVSESVKESGERLL